MELFSLIILCFLLFTALFLLFQLLVFIYRKFFKKSDNLKNWSKEQLDQIQSLLKNNPNVCASLDPKLIDANVIFNNLLYTNTINSIMSINTEYDNQKTVSDNCDSFDGYRGRLKGSEDGHPLNKVFEPIKGDHICGETCPESCDNPSASAPSISSQEDCTRTEMRTIER